MPTLKPPAQPIVLMLGDKPLELNPLPKRFSRLLAALEKLPLGKLYILSDLISHTNLSSCTIREAAAMSEFAAYTETFRRGRLWGSQATITELRAQLAKLNAKHSDAPSQS